MATKTISISEDAYEVLKNRKTKGESFSDVIRRTVGSKSVLDFAGMLSKSESDDLKESIEQSRARSRRRYA